MMYKNDSYCCGSHVISAHPLFSMFSFTIKYVCDTGIVAAKNSDALCF